MSLVAIDPTSGQVIKSYAEMNSEEVRLAIESAAAAYNSWSTTSFADRAELCLMCLKYCASVRRNLLS